MRFLVQQLCWIQKKYPYDEKFFIAPSYRDGNTLLEALTLHVPTLHFQVKTIQGLTSPLIPPEYSMPSNPLLNHLVWNILMELSQEKGLQYFRPESISYSLAIAVRLALFELKSAGYTGSTLPVHSFVSREKGQDMKLLFQAYEKGLEERQWLDWADSIRSAIDHFQANAVHFILIVPQDMYVTDLEGELLKCLMDKTPCYGLFGLSIPGAPVPYQKAMPGLQKIPVQWEEENSIFQYLYSLPDCPRDEKVKYNLYSAYGVSNEVREVLRRIKAQNQPLDEVAVYTTMDEPYCQLIWEMASSYGIPVTFGNGLSIVNFRPGRLCLALLDWIQDDFSVQTFISILRSGDLNLFDDDDDKTINRFVRLLRRSGIGRFAQRYKQVLKDSDDSMEAWAASFFQELFQEIPQVREDGSMDYGHLLSGLHHIMTKYSRVQREEDGQARQAILDILTQLREYPLSVALTLTEILYQLRRVIGQLRVGNKSSKPGHLHVDSCGSSRYLYRRYVYCIGLDNSRFPGMVAENPVLLDVERKNMGNVTRPTQMPAQRLMNMLQLLPNLQSDITFSYTSFDTVENREMFPSALFLQLYRLLKKDASLDYSTLQAELPADAVFTPLDVEGAVGPGECWLQYLNGRGRRHQRGTVLEHFPFLKKGAKAWQERLKGELNGCMGLVSDEPLDISQEIFSATRLEMLGACPYKFFLRYILQIKPLEDLTYDSNSWLDPLSRGTLLHRIFEDFFKELKERGELPSVEKHGDLLENIVKIRARAMSEEILVPSALVYEVEVAELLQSARVFLASEEAHSEVLPEYLELNFGPEGSYPPAHITLPSGVFFLLQGRIDRADRIDDAYTIIDYKTGSTYHYKPSGYINGGRQLQHALYAMAFEIIMGNAVRVIRSGYVFPTLKGEAQRFLREQNQRGVVQEALDTLLSLIQEKSFPVTDDPKTDCAFCEYPAICRREELEDSWNEVFSSGPDHIQQFKEVRKYD